MSRTIYNEGRVVGLSAYEIFVKHAIAAGIDPNDVPSEQAWLSSCVAMGSSLILYVPAGTSAITDLPFPVKPSVNPGEPPTVSALAAANTIIGSFFNGTGAYPTGAGPQWVTSITDYGNGSATNPQPATPNQDALTDYLKIVDGNVNQSGDRTGQPPEMTQPYLVPDLTSNGTATVSITFSTATTHGFYLQLTGFTDRSVLAGVVGTDGNQQATDNPQNGDFIGPEVFPWSTKIVFTVPTSVIGSAINQEVVNFPNNTIGYALKTKIGSVERKSISLSDTSGNDLSVTVGSTPSLDSGNVAAEQTDTLSWKALLYALKNNKLINLVGSVLKTWRDHLHYSATDREFTVGGSNDAQSLKVNGDIAADGGVNATGKIFSGHTVGRNNTEFNYIIIDKAGTRLYISGSEPTESVPGSIPDGSIGIGWT